MFIVHPYVLRFIAAAFNFLLVDATLWYLHAKCGSYYFHNFSRAHIPCSTTFFRFVKCQQFALIASITWHFAVAKLPTSARTIHSTLLAKGIRNSHLLDSILATSDDVDGNVLCDSNMKSMFGNIPWKKLLLSQKAKLCNATWLKEWTLNKPHKKSFIINH